MCLLLYRKHSSDLTENNICDAHPQRSECVSSLLCAAEDPIVFKRIGVPQTHHPRPVQRTPPSSWLSCVRPSHDTMMVPLRKQQNLCHFIRSGHLQHLCSVSLAVLPGRLLPHIKRLHSVETSGQRWDRHTPWAASRLDQRQRRYDSIPR